MWFESFTERIGTDEGRIRGAGNKSWACYRSIEPDWRGRPRVVIHNSTFTLWSNNMRTFRIKIVRQRVS